MFAFQPLPWGLAICAIIIAALFVTWRLARPRGYAAGYAEGKAAGDAAGAHRARVLTVGESAASMARWRAEGDAEGARRGYAAGLVEGRVEGEAVGVTRGRDQVEAELASRRLADDVAKTGVPARTRQNGGRRRGDPR
jgi:flagellar biosynthesis/type III secretory pathway protein FliH